MPEDRIQYLKQNEINKTSWDQCIEEAENGLIYAYSFYLEQMSENWDALVLNDYKAVMPLPWKKKAGISYVYQPALTAQLGVFGNNITPSLLKNFMDAIPEKFRLIEYPLNYKNFFLLKNYGMYARKNFVLDISQPYENLYNNYRDHIKRNIKKSTQFGNSLQKNISVDEINVLADQHPGALPERDLNQFKKLFKSQQKNGKAKAYGIYSKQNELLSAAAFLFSHNRAYYILVGNHPNGRTLGASHALVDAFIHDHAAQNLVLDFEGSDISKLAFFYSSFGAKEENYTAIKWNRLPFYLKWMKR